MTTLVPDNYVRKSDNKVVLAWQCKRMNAGPQPYWLRNLADYDRITFVAVADGMSITYASAGVLHSVRPTQWLIYDFAQDKITHCDPETFQQEYT